MLKSLGCESAASEAKLTLRHESETEISPPSESGFNLGFALFLGFADAQLTSTQKGLGSLKQDGIEIAQRWVRAKDTRLISFCHECSIEFIHVAFGSRNCAIH